MILDRYKKVAGYFEYKHSFVDKRQHFSKIQIIISNPIYTYVLCVYFVVYIWPKKQ